MVCHRSIVRTDVVHERARLDAETTLVGHVDADSGDLRAARLSHRPVPERRDHDGDGILFDNVQAAELEAPQVALGVVERGAHVDAGDVTVLGVENAHAAADDIGIASEHLQRRPERELQGSDLCAGLRSQSAKAQYPDQLEGDGVKILK